MIPVWYLLAVLAVCAVLLVIVLRQNAMLVRAVIAKNSGELAHSERSATPTLPLPARVRAEEAAPKMRPLGLS